LVIHIIEKALKDSHKKIPFIALEKKKPDKIIKLKLIKIEAVLK
jgi:hypothetical protein